MIRLKPVLGYLKSVSELRKTRLSLEAIHLKLDRLQHDIRVPGKTGGNTRVSGAPLLPFHLLDIMSAELLTAIGNRNSVTTFEPAKYLDSQSEFRKLYTNGEVKDLDGGFHENLKTLLRTSEIRRDVGISEMNGVVILVQRLRQGEFWKALQYARYYGKDLLFAETAFFGAFAGYFSKDVPPVFRKSFGYILDDQSYYFDARIPSRLENYLNSSDSSLTLAEQARAESLIKRIISEGITKYNFNVRPQRRVSVAAGSVLVIDQKKGDASIEFGGGSAETFKQMLTAALRENPSSQVLVKLHPDNQGRHAYPADERLVILEDSVNLTDLLDQCSKVYVVSSQVGFEALLRDKQVEVFGLPFYAGWGLTNDRQNVPRRDRTLTKYELFHAACIRHSVYVNPDIGERVEIEAAFDWMLEKLRHYHEGRKRDRNLFYG